MDLANYNWPEVTQVDLAFPTFNTTEELVKEAESRDLKKGRSKFNDLFYNGGSVELKPDIKDTWREKAWLFCRVLIGSYAPKHQDKEAVCAMLMEECLVL